MTPTSRSRWAIAVGAVVAGVLLVTLWPDPPANTANFVPLREHGDAAWCLLSGCNSAGEAAWFLAKDVAGNLIIFVPVGIVFAGLLGGWSNRRRFWAAVAAGAALSLAIEVIQLTIPTRATDVDDLLFNTVGAAVGAGLLIWYQRRMAGSET